MRTMRITLVGGPHCGETPTDCPHGAQAHTFGGVRYIRSDRRDSENRQVFLAAHSRTIKGLKACNLA